MKNQAPGADRTPKIATLKPAEALKRVSAHKGEISLGQAVFARATCNACHTVSQNEKQKGPYLGNIAETYRRNELAESILVPNKTIAQGFATNVFSLKDGKSFVGFVTDEAGDTVSGAHGRIHRPRNGEPPRLPRVVGEKIRSVGILSVLLTSDV